MSQEIEQIKRSLKALEQQLAELEKKEKKESVQNRMIPEMSTDDVGWCIVGDLHGKVMFDRKGYWYDDNCFPTEEMVRGYADAFNFMLQIRMQEGSGVVGENGCGWYPLVNADSDNIVYCCWSVHNYAEKFSLIPPFPTEKALKKAIENCGGEERVLRIMKFLSNVKG